MSSAFIKFLCILWALLAITALTAMSKKLKPPTPRPSPVPSYSTSCAGLGPDTECHDPYILLDPQPGYASVEEIKSLNYTQDAINRTIQSDCFRSFMLKQKMNSTNGRTPSQVVDHLVNLRGRIVVVMYRRSMQKTSAVASSYVGGMRTSSGRIHQVRLNSAYFNSSKSACRWAATLGGHEGLGHSMGGYGHTANWTRFREDTVPYLLSGRKSKYGGDVFDACCK